MKKVQLFCLLSMLLSGVVSAQSFEGVVTYTIDVEILPQAAQMGITKATLINKMKEQNIWSDTETVTYKAGFYRTELLSPKRTWTIYRSDSNKIYHLQEGLNECMVTNAATGDIPIAKQIDSTVTVLGHLCKIVRVSWNSTGDMYVEYAYSSDSAWHISPMLYTHHIYDGWYNYLSIGSEVPLQIKRMINSIGVTTYTAIRINKERIDPKTFALPPMHTDTMLSAPAANVQYMKIDK